MLKLLNTCFPQHTLVSHRNLYSKDINGLHTLSSFENNQRRLTVHKDDTRCVLGTKRPTCQDPVRLAEQVVDLKVT